MTAMQQTNTYSLKYCYSDNRNMLTVMKVEWFGSAKSDSTHHFFGNASTKSGSLQFPQLSGC